MPAQRMHMKTPRFHDAHRGPEGGDVHALMQRWRGCDRGGAAAAGRFVPPAHTSDNKTIQRSALSNLNIPFEARGPEKFKGNTRFQLLPQKV